MKLTASSGNADGTSASAGVDGLQHVGTLHLQINGVEVLARAYASRKTSSN